MICQHAASTARVGTFGKQGNTLTLHVLLQGKLILMVTGQVKQHDFVMSCHGSYDRMLSFFSLITW